MTKRGFEIAHQPIPEDRLATVGAYVADTIRRIPEEWVEHDVETQRIEIGNLIYEGLHGKGFNDGQILTIRDLIFTELRQPRMGD